MAMHNMAMTGIVLVLLSVVVVECRVCTRMTSEKFVKTQNYPAECHQSYWARCGWFSNKQCLFNETVACIKQHNTTITLYRVIEDCCPGYKKDEGGLCTLGDGKAEKADSNKEKKVKDGKTVISDSDQHSGITGSDISHGTYSGEDGGGDFLGLTPGAYAGIVCGILFVACVALLTALHYRKKQRRQEKMAGVNSEQDATQKQQMIPLEKVDNLAVTT